MVFGGDGDLLVQSGIAAIGAAMMVAGDDALVVAGGTFRDDVARCGTFRDDGDSFEDSFEDTFRATMLVTGVDDGDAAEDVCLVLVTGVDDGDAAEDVCLATMLGAGVDDGDALIRDFTIGVVVGEDSEIVVV